MLTRHRKPHAGPVTLGIGAAAVAIVCCAGVPAVVALLGGLTFGAVVGLGFGALLLGALAWTATAILVRKRRHADIHNRRRQR